MRHLVMINTLIALLVSGTAMAAGPTDKAQKREEQKENRVQNNDPEGKTLMEQKEYKIKNYGPSPAASQAIEQRSFHTEQPKKPNMGGGKGK